MYERIDVSTPRVPEAATRITDREVIVRRPSAWQAVARWVSLLFGILQALLLLRVVLLLLIANRENEIVAFILQVTGPFVTPFADMFALARVETSTGAVLDIAALVALVGWTLVEALVLAVVSRLRGS